MINRINIYLISIFTALSAIAAIFMSGKRAGKLQIKVKQNEAIIETQKRINEAGNISNDDAIDSLQKGEF